MFTIRRAAEGGGKSRKKSGLSKVQMFPLKIAANSSSVELQNSSYNLVIISLSDIMRALVINSLLIDI